MPELTSPRLVLRPVQPRDEPALRAMLREPSVARWWGPDDDVGPPTDPQDRRWAIDLRDGGLAGMIQSWEEPEPSYRFASIDVLLGAVHQGRGLGGEAVHRLCRHLLEDHGHHRLTIDPATANERAIACYSRVGFRPVGVMRRCWWDHQQEQWHDGLLMDLLADELRDPAPGATA